MAMPCAEAPAARAKLTAPLRANILIITNTPCRRHAPTHVNSHRLNRLPAPEFQPAIPQGERAGRTPAMAASP